MFKPWKILPNGQDVTYHESVNYTSKANFYDMDDRGSIPNKGRIFLFIKNVHTGSETHLVYYPLCTDEIKSTYTTQRSIISNLIRDLRFSRR
jgi:hypothetical protein